MAGIGADVAETLVELGSPVTVVKVTGDEYGEFADFESFFKDSVDSNRQFGYAGSHPYNSSIESGDLVLYREKYLLVLNSKPNIFEQEIVDINTYLVECNCNGKFVRLSEVRDTSSASPTYKLAETWTVLFESVKGLQFERDQFNDKLADVMQLPAYSQRLYTQALDVQIGDRWFPNEENDTEYYRVLNITKHKYVGCNFYTLEPDTR